jgi:hypothetical protein
LSRHGDETSHLLGLSSARLSPAHASQSLHRARPTTSQASMSWLFPLLLALRLLASFFSRTRLSCPPVPHRPSFPHPPSHLRQAVWLVCYLAAKTGVPGVGWAPDVGIWGALRSLRSVFYPGSPCSQKEIPQPSPWFAHVSLTPTLCPVIDGQMLPCAALSSPCPRPPILRQQPCPS